MQVSVTEGAGVEYKEDRGPYNEHVASYLAGWMS